MTRGSLFLVFGVVLSVTGCGSTSLTRTGARAAPKGENCEFQIYTAAPAGGFVEIATVDVEPGSYGSNMYTRLSDFKQEITPFVCKAGGDAAVATVNGYGMYIKATVLKTSGVATSAPTLTQASAPAGGCSFDAQCKGDRVCTSGQCVDPVRR